MKIYYLGSFPPPYGGVTVKNQNLYAALSEKLEIEKIDFSEIKHGGFKTAWRFARCFFGRQSTFAIGVSGKKTRRRFCRLLYYCNRPAMNRSVLFLMGGSVSKDIAADVKYQKYVREYKQIYVETYGMMRELAAAGLTNVGYYPNCRFRPAKGPDVSPTTSSGPLKCVFFSLIQPQKGADLVLEAAKQTPEISYAFYGPVDEAYKDEFLHALEQVNNAQYYGAFSGTPDEVYNELSKYDVLLFPTKWDTEGVPGILVEAKISGVSCVVSARSYNEEIVHDRMEGIVLENNTAAELTRALRELDKDRALLGTLKENNAKSSTRYYIDNYIEMICKTLRGG